MGLGELKKEERRCYMCKHNELCMRALGAEICYRFEEKWSHRSDRADREIDRQHQEMLKRSADFDRHLATISTLKTVIGAMLRAASQDEYTALERCPEAIRGRVEQLQADLRNWRDKCELARAQLADLKRNGLGPTIDTLRVQLDVAYQRLRKLLGHD